jgi:hypothetical protein
MQESTVSLYLDLVPGQYADLEIAAQALVKFSELIKVFAKSVEPVSEIQIELISGIPGSLDFKILVRG